MHIRRLLAPTAAPGLLPHLVTGALWAIGTVAIAGCAPTDDGEAERTGSAAQAVKTKCYQDSDADGYYTSQSFAGSTCPSGWSATPVGRSGDCNDADASIHPRAPEQLGVDANCTDGVGEPTFEWAYTYRPGDGAKPLMNWMLVKINDVAQDASLVATLARYGFQLSVTSTSSGSTAITTVPARFQRYDADSRAAWFLPMDSITSTLDRHATYVITLQIYDFTTSSLIGVPSQQTVNMTMGDTAHPSTAFDVKQHDIVLAAAVELADSNKGVVGYMGSEAPNGSRYNGGNVDGTAWCKYFYRWVVQGATGATTVCDTHGGRCDGGFQTMGGDVENYFKDAADDAAWGDGEGAGYFYYRTAYDPPPTSKYLVDTADLFDGAAPGDLLHHSPYAAADTHVAMLMGYDPAAAGCTYGGVWSIGGSVNDNVNLGQGCIEYWGDGHWTWTAVGQIAVPREDSANYSATAAYHNSGDPTYMVTNH